MRSLVLPVVATLLAGTGLEARAQDGLCNPDETPFFSCRTRAGRWASLCGTPPTSLQYRYGRPGTLEMVYPDTAQDGAKSFFIAHLATGHTDRTEISFERLGIRYSLFDHQEDGNRRAGVRVETPDARINRVSCAGEPGGRLMDLKDLLACQKDNSLGAPCP